MRQTTQEPTVDVDELRERVRSEADPQREALKALVRIASVSRDVSPPPREIVDCCDAVVRTLREAGMDSAHSDTITYQGKETFPLVFAHEPCRLPVPDAPTVVIYSHYDVQPATKADGWDTEPFVPEEKPDGDDTRLYGRGAADDKSGIVMHLGVWKALQDRLPVNLKFVFEGEEEIGRGVLEAYLADPSTRDDRFTGDLVVVADTGNLAVGVPTLTSTLRGIAVFDVTVDTLRQPMHSGMYGGPAPDAFMVLTRVLASLHDDGGDVAVPGLVRDDAFPWDPVDEQRFRADAGVLDGVPLVGSGTLAQRLFGRPSINVVGLDGPKPWNESTNVLCHHAKARISVRLAPSQDPESARQALQQHLDAQRPWGVTPKVEFVAAGAGYKADTDGPYYRMALESVAEAYGETTARQTGQGGSIPLVHSFHKLNPHADIVLWGCEEPRARIHGTNESVSYRELEAMTLAEALLLARAGGQTTTSGGSR
ncbi:Acetylornithine deacetylase/Succinyl-diaminopimelate desuccinylase [Streptoalloteichus tenebrarius]|uniref:Acetylornithine deacetylase/Succinyl-diaminopimelate desuccinylase n=1 Tax=Streptoalloteichus tenebrarius (strain ATCC 17920 / DSM 40477 / JCM 4838 / CBS 697.72 / NBRC 16177 / NCIMB 11028 / NRRL B-12390 / A12253. 1 / ISP 5477) TaxID=1933 RepID=A0ABT1I099_STRSD|nr:M20/M25/M40 family metallo-hydrolase [Streptoalloteichus tenebrarius]MCP2261213.1 Acetylornithine deacetylase/Succinyl-diaminopimelate desuccinylase [Streptoalloteichus tenebrarius]BFF02925.1 dipeptidase [Streptoalloteichus tenebrarius]